MLFERSDSGLAKYTAIVKIFTMKFILDDPLWMISIKIMVILDKSPFESVRSMAETLSVNHAIVLYHLHEYFVFKSFHLHRVLHVSTDELCDKQKNYAKRMLTFLHAAERND
jgi:hypothetical protein